MQFLPAPQVNVSTTGVTVHKPGRQLQNGKVAPDVQGTCRPQWNGMCGGVIVHKSLSQLKITGLVVDGIEVSFSSSTVVMIVTTVNVPDTMRVLVKMLVSDTTIAAVEGSCGMVVLYAVTVARPFAVTVLELTLAVNVVSPFVESTVGDCSDSSAVETAVGCGVTDLEIVEAAIVLEKLRLVERVVFVRRKRSVEGFKSADGVGFVEKLEVEARLRIVEDVALMGEVGRMLGDVVDGLVIGNEVVDVPLLDVVAELIVVSGLVVAEELVAGGVDVVVGPTAGGKANVRDCGVPDVAAVAGKQPQSPHWPGGPPEDLKSGFHEPEKREYCEPIVEIRLHTEH